MQSYNVLRIFINLRFGYCKNYRMARILIVDDDVNVRRFLVMGGGGLTEPQILLSFHFKVVCEALS